MTLESEIEESLDFSYGLLWVEGAFGDMLSDSESLTIDTGIDPNVASSYTFEVYQTSIVNLKEGSTANYTLNVKVTDFLLNLESGGTVEYGGNSNQSNDVTLSVPGTQYDAFYLTNTEANVKVTPGSVQNADDYQEVDVDLSYKQGITDGVVLFDFEVSWEDKQYLEAGTYTSVITLSYSTE